MGATAVLSTGYGVVAFGAAGVPLGVVVTLRTLDTMTDWALYSISMQSERLDREYDDAAGLRSASLAF